MCTEAWQQVKALLFRELQMSGVYRSPQSEEKHVWGLAKQLGFILKPSGASEALHRKECDPVIQFESDFLEWYGGRTGIEQLCLEAKRPMRKPGPQ